MECTLGKIAGMKRDSYLPTGLFIPENLVTTFCPDQDEPLLFEDRKYFPGSERWDFRYGP